jgi:hypothetical protein
MMLLSKGHHIDDARRDTAAFDVSYVRLEPCNLVRVAGVGWLHRWRQQAGPARVHRLHTLAGSLF